MDGNGHTATIRDELQHRKHADAILTSRDYAFCLYPRRNFERLLDNLPR